MPQISNAYAAGRVRVLERTLLSRASMDRLLAAQNDSDVARQLAEMEWGEARTKSDVETLADEHVKKACILMRECSAEPDVTDCFLLKYDILNLKILLKARVLKEDPGALSECGTIDAELIRRNVEENSYLALPEEFRAVMERIEKRVAVEMDPLFVDVELDKAYGAMIESRMAKCKIAPVKAYFTAQTELTNLIIALRCANMKRDAEFALDLLIPGGTLNPEAVAHLANEPDKAFDLVRYRPYAGAVKDALGQNRLTDRLVALERAKDDYLLSLIRDHRYEPVSVLPLIGYLLAREREAAMVRLMVTAKAANVSEDRLSARLRALYT